MAACLHARENALDLGFEAFAEVKKDETEQAKPEIK